MQLKNEIKEIIGSSNGKYVCAGSKNILQSTNRFFNNIKIEDKLI